IPTDEKIVMKRLSRVIDPLAGLDVVKTKLVREVTIEKGEVEVFVELPLHHQFSNNIKNEIIERIKPLWDVNKVKVIFRGD
ncbi:DUF59 domain-containing protein, partial [bacterium]|nr:DUF59 domain-containing protein [bacterium]